MKYLVYWGIMALEINLIKIIAGVFSQDEGEIFIHGKSVTISDQLERRN